VIGWIAALLAGAALSNDVHVSSASDSNGRADGTDTDEGVLANLPRTRPQRSSPRRDAARRATAAAQGANGAAPPARATGAKPKTPGAKPKAASAKPKAASRPKTAASKPKAPARKPAAAKSKAPRAGRAPVAASASAARPRGGASRAGARAEVPRQGFESEMDRAKGSVQPPGGAELVVSAAEMIGELAKSGLSTGERLLKDALTRLPF